MKCAGKRRSYAEVVKDFNFQFACSNMIIRYAFRSIRNFFRILTEMKIHPDFP